MIITITGTPGAGKTSAAKILAKRLNMKFYSAGDILEKMADEKGVTIDELISGNDDADHEIDGFQKKLGKTEDNIIVEGKIAWHMIPRSFKILVTVDEHEGARRIYDDKKTGGHRTDEPDYSSTDEAEKIMRLRVERYVAKFKRLYGIDNYFDSSHYDLVLDTTNAKSPEENADRIMAAMKERGLI
jgi:cytidylate kinase